METLSGLCVFGVTYFGTNFRYILFRELLISKRKTMVLSRFGKLHTTRENEYLESG